MAAYTSTVLITGGTQGLGYHAARPLASQRPKSLIVIASRKDSDDAAATINRDLNQSNVRYMPLDLGSLATVRDFAERWTTANLPPISALVLNAGVQFPGDVEYTPDGIEKHFGINHVGHALLFHLLLPNLTSDARIVVVASGVHDPAQGWGLKPAYTTPDACAQPDEAAAKNSNGRGRYATSKVANVLWAAALGRQLNGKPEHAGKTVLSFDPGLMFATEFTREAAWPVRFLSRHIAPHLIGLARRLWKENIHLPDESGANLAWLTVCDEVKGMERMMGMKGGFFEEKRERMPSDQAQKEDLQEELWRWTADRVASGRDEKVRFTELRA